MILAIALAASAITIPEGDALRQAIVAADTRFFDLEFTGCDTALMRTLITPDIEFYHDKGGVIARDADGFIADYGKSCHEKLKPDAWRSRRELVAATLTVHPIPGYGAIEDGQHQFYERKGDGPEKLVGNAHFTIVWQLVDGQWRLSRALSYGHRPIGE